MNHNVIISGCTGEIGNALVRLLLAQGAEIWALVRPHSWRRRFLPDSSRLHAVACELSAIAQLAKLPCDSCDAFFHLGWQASYGPKRDDPYGQTANIAAALDAVHLAARLGCSVFVGAGSQAQYGNTDQILTPDTPMRPDTPYGAAKLCAEHMTRQLCARLGLRHVWGRVLSVYGPCDGPYTLMTYLMRCHLRGEEAMLTPCEQCWDYLFAEDAARAFMALAEAGRDGRAYCVASGRCRPLREYLEEWRQALNGAPRLRMGGKPYAPDQRMRLCGDISSLTEDTGFSPHVSFVEGISRTFHWYADHPEALNG